jgi:hypothetical protein
MSNHVWVYPGDTTIDLVKRLMRTYRQALLDRDPEACADIDRIAHGEPRTSVMIPTAKPYDPDEMVSDQDAAHMAEVSPITIRKWASEGLIQRYTGEDGSRRFRVCEILAVKQQQRQSRARRAS